jgi:ribosomal protein S12 methylthiotransferase
MGRNYNKQALLALFDRIRSTLPGAAIRTTLIVGFPGETEDDFKELMEFVEQVRFDHLGVFTYSDAEDLPSHGLGGHVAKKVARSRRGRLMERQMAISESRLAALVGKTLPVLIEATAEPHLYEGRSILQAPEVDGITYVSTGSEGPGVSIGDIATVRITEALEYDLIGNAI